MARIKGETIILINLQDTGEEDDFGQPITKPVEIEVHNVLIAPTSTDDIVNNTELYGKKAVYTLAIPKGDTNDWEDKEVKFWGDTYRTFGKPIRGIESMIPLDWNMKVMVEIYG